MKSSATHIRCETPTGEISTTSGTTQRDEVGREVGGGFRIGGHMYTRG